MRDDKKMSAVHADSIQGSHYILVLKFKDFQGP